MKKNVIIAILSTALAIVLFFVAFAIFSYEPEEDTQDMSSIFENDFIAGCVDEGATYTQCSCAFDSLLDEYGSIGLLEMAIEYDEGKEMPNRAIAATLKCW